MRYPRPVLVVALLLWGATWARAQERVLTKAIEVRALSMAEAEQGLSVRLRGIVVFVESKSALFLQDDTSTTFFRLDKAELPTVGDEVELSARTRMGLYLPGLDFATVRVLGHRDLPPGIPARYDDLVFSRYHYQRVALEGIFRSISPLDEKKSIIRLAMGSQVIEARIEKPTGEGQTYIGHRVRITGLAVGSINIRRQLVQPYLRVLDWNEIEVLATAPPISGVPQISAEELLAFRAAGHGEQRVRMEGVVTAMFPPHQVFLRQDHTAFEARLSTPAQLEPGDRIMLAGFPTIDRYSAAVVDAELVSREPGAAPQPDPVGSLDELAGLGRDRQPEKHDNNLVRVTGTLRDAFKIEDGTALLLQGKERTMQARLPQGVDVPAIGSRVRLTGICQVASAVIASGGFNTLPGIVSLRLRSSDDVEILQRPSWWTPQRLSAVLAALAGVTLLAGLWIAVLRRQVTRQTSALRKRIESEVALEERQRIAREFHDTLEQELTGISLRLDALATRELDQKGRDLITASRNLVARIQSETRNLISDLRDPSETAGDLVAALTAVAAQRSADSDVAVQIEPVGPVPALPAGTVHDLRMIARESVTNAIRHGGATRVTIHLEPDASRLYLRIMDNGCGFDPAAMEANAKRGHFGCAGIRERSRKLGAEVSWQSAPGNGTTVSVVVPLGKHRRDPGDILPLAAVQSSRESVAAS